MAGLLMHDDGRSLLLLQKAASPTNQTTQGPYPDPSLRGSRLCRNNCAVSRARCVSLPRTQWPAANAVLMRLLRQSEDGQRWREAGAPPTMRRINPTTLGSHRG